MTVDSSRILAELPLPLAPDAGEADVIAIAIALEDACGIVLEDHSLTIARLGRPETIAALLAPAPGGR